MVIQSKLNVLAPPNAGKTWWIQTLRHFGIHCVDTDEMLKAVRCPGYSEYDHDKWRFIRDDLITCEVLVTNMFKLPELVDTRGQKVLVLPTWWQGTPNLLRRLPMVDEVLLTPFHVAQAAVSGRLLERFVYTNMSYSSNKPGLIERSLARITAPGIYAVKITETVTFRKRFTIESQDKRRFAVKFLRFEQANNCAYFEASLA